MSPLDDERKEEVENQKMNEDCRLAGLSERINLLHLNPIFIRRRNDNQPTSRRMMFTGEDIIRKLT